MVVGSRRARRKQQGWRVNPSPRIMIEHPSQPRPRRQRIGRRRGGQRRVRVAAADEVEKTMGGSDQGGWDALKRLNWRNVGGPPDRKTTRAESLETG